MEGIVTALSGPDLNYNLLAGIDNRRVLRLFGG
jgi:hypothetical protein